MKKILLAVFIFGFTSNLISQSYPIRDLRVYSVLAILDSSSGTAFILTDEKSIFFCTARHVLYDPSTPFRLKADSLKGVYYGNDSEIDPPSKLIINLKLASANRSIWSDRGNDAVIIKIAEFDQEPQVGLIPITYMPWVKKFGPSHIQSQPISATTKFREVKTASEILMIGYPSTIFLRGINMERPLYRSGKVASKDYMANRIITDAPSFGGNSGGLVYNLGPDGTYKPIGFVSERSIFAERAIKDQSDTTKFNQPYTISNAGYSIIVPIDIIINLIQQRINF